MEGLSVQQQARLAALFSVGDNVDSQSIYRTVNTQVPVLTAGRPWAFNLDKLDVVNRVWLRHALSISTGATPGTPVARRRNPAEGLGRISVLVNGVPEFSMDSDMAFCVAQLFRGRMDALELTGLTNAGLATASSTQTAAVNIPVDFVLPNVEPRQAGMVPAGNTNITAVTFNGVNAGVVASYMDSAGATQSISSQTLIPTLERQIIPGALASPTFPGFGSWWRQQQDQQIPSTGTYTMKFTGGRRYIGIAIRTVVGTTSAVSDAVLTTGQKVQVLANGIPVYEDYPESIIGTTAAALPAGFDRTGFYFLNFLRMPWKASQAILAGNQDLQLLFSGTTGTNAFAYAVPVVLMPQPDAAYARGIRGFI